jgi:hypothetical protein
VSAAANEPFVTQLRTHGDVIDLAGDAPDAFVIRGQLHEAWDAVRLRVARLTPLRAVKSATLSALLGSAHEAAEYMAKVRGGEVRDETQSCEAAGVRAGTTVLVHLRRRRPVR